jgi:urea carboxylase
LTRDWGSAVIHQIEKNGSQPLVLYRQGGDDFILIHYGRGAFDLNYRCHAVALYQKLRDTTGDINFSYSLHTGIACGNSLMLYYDGIRIPRQKLLDHLLKLESDLGDLSTAKMPSRRFRLPLTFSSKKQEASIQRYMETQRPYAAYLLDTMDFIAKNNAFTQQQFRDVFLNASLMMVTVGFFTAFRSASPSTHARG